MSAGEEFLSHQVGSHGEFVVDWKVLWRRLQRDTSGVLLHTRVSDRLRRLADEIDSGAKSRGYSLDHAEKAVEGYAEILDSGIESRVLVLNDLPDRTSHVLLRSLDLVGNALDLIAARHQCSPVRSGPEVAASSVPASTVQESPGVSTPGAGFAAGADADPLAPAASSIGGGS